MRSDCQKSDLTLGINKILTGLSTGKASYPQDPGIYSQDIHGSSYKPLASWVAQPRKSTRARASIVPSKKQCVDCSEWFDTISVRRERCDPCRELHLTARKKAIRKRNYEKYRDRNIQRQRERMARLEAEGKAKDVKRKYRKAQRARYLAAGLTINGAPRKQPLRDAFSDKIKSQRLAYRKWHREWLRIAAPNGCVAAWYQGTGKPWNNPRIDSAEKFKVRYHEDNEFRAREILKSQHRKKSRSARITAQSDGTLTPKALGQLFAEARFCAYCMKEFEGYKDKTADHVEPLYLGGKHSIDNIVIACFSCNSSKGRKSLIQWLIAAQPT